MSDKDAREISDFFAKFFASGGESTPSPVASKPDDAAQARHPFDDPTRPQGHAAPPPGQPGRDPFVGRLAGNFRITDRLGTGGMGAVYLGEHVHIGSKVAVKVLHPHLATQSDNVARFFAEARAANVTGHENIVRVIDMNAFPEGGWYLVMEYLEGQPLSAFQRLEPVAAARVLSQVCDGLGAVHARGVVHRDLKPDNIFLVPREGREPLVKIVDFGIAMLRTARASENGLVAGTPEFMPPEQWEGEALDQRADLYALGLTAFRILTGAQPFNARNTEELARKHFDEPLVRATSVRPELPTLIDSVLSKACAKNPADRYQTAKELKAALEGALLPAVFLAAAASESTPRPPPPAPAPPPVAAPPPPAPVVPKSVAGTFELGVEVRDVSVSGLTRGGGLVECAPPFPALFSRGVLTVPWEGVTKRFTAEVVRHVSADEAAQWGTGAGFAVQIRGEAPAPAPVSVPGRPRPAGVASSAPAVKPVSPLELAEGLAKMELAVAHGPYVLLGADPDANTGDLRTKERQLLARLEGWKAQRPPADVMVKLEALERRVEACLEPLRDLRSRAAFDADKGNWRGVARCVASGLTVSDLSALRAKFLETRRSVASQSLVRQMSGRAHLAAKDLAGARRELEAGLRLDPLNLELHQTYWRLVREG